MLLIHSYIKIKNTILDKKEQKNQKILTILKKIVSFIMKNVDIKNNFL